MYGRTAHVYDLVYRAVGKDYAAEADELAALLPGATTLLDVACGTGLHLELLRDRFDVAGVDLDPGMLAEARRRLPGVELHEGDMRTFDLGRTFDAVTCLFSAVAHLPTAADLDQAIARMAAHLAPGGVLVVDGFVRPELWDTDAVSAVSITEPGIALARTSWSRREGNRVTLEMHHLVTTPEGTEHLVDVHEATLFTDEQYRHAFEAAGLAVEVAPNPHPGRDRYVSR